MNHARKTGGPRPTTLRLVPSEPSVIAPSRDTAPPSTYDSILDGLGAVDIRDEVPSPSPTEVPGSPEAPSVPEPSVPEPSEPVTPAQPEEPIQPIDPTPDEETPDPEPAEV